MQSRVCAWTTSEQRQEDLQSTEYIEGCTLKWIKQLEQIADLALRPLDDMAPNYDLAAKILLGLVELSSVGRQRVEITGPDSCVQRPQPFAAFK